MKKHQNSFDLVLLTLSIIYFDSIQKRKVEHRRIDFKSVLTYLRGQSLTMKTAFIIILSAALIACSPDKPSIGLVKEKLEEKITNQSKGLIKLVSINKTDGLESEINGVSMYEFTYTYEIEILKDVFKCGYGVFESPSFQENFVVSDQKPIQRGFIPIRCTLFKKGVKITLFDKATFYKSESGWQSGKFK